MTEDHTIDVTLKAQTGGYMGSTQWPVGSLTLDPVEALTLAVLKHAAQRQGNTHVKLDGQQFLDALWDRVGVAIVNLRTLGYIEGAQRPAFKVSEETQRMFDARAAADHQQDLRDATVRAQAAKQTLPRGFPER